MIPKSKPLSHSNLPPDSLFYQAGMTNTGPTLPCVRSEDLFGKDREIMIEHGGAYYLLRLTRANKLILTK